MDLFGDLPPPSEKRTHTKSLCGNVPGQNVNTKRLSEDSISEESTKKVKVENNSEKQVKLFALKSFIAERQGEREEMQDAAVLMDDCTANYSHCDCGIKITRASFFGVFDGHGGKRASNYAKEHIHKYINNNFPKEKVEHFDRELKRRLIKAFKETDEEFLKEASKETPQWRDGSTASCVLVINNVLYVANIGDSKTLLVRENEGENTVINLSKDHSPTLYEERQRIQNAGGFVRDGRVQGVLEVSRAFGDIRFKKYVTATPDIFKATLTEKDRYLLIACDGLWKGLKVNEAVDFIDNIVKDNTSADIDVRFETACKELANEAIRRGSSDNVTVVLIRIF